MEQGGERRPPKHSEANGNDNKAPEYFEFNSVSGEISTSSDIQSSTERELTVIDNSKWVITAVQIYTVNGMPIFSANYSSDLSDFDSSVVLQFYKTVEKFAENNLNTKLIDFKVADERIFFRISNDHIFIISTRLGSHIRSGNSSETYVTVSALITDISSLLSFDSSNDLGEEFSLVNAITELVSEVNENQYVTPTDHVEINKLDISYVVITDDTGVPYLSRVYDNSDFNDDPMLLTMFLHALNVFFNTNFSEDLSEINFGNSRLYIKNHSSHFYAILVKLPDFLNLREDSPIHNLSANVLNQMVDLVADLDDDIEVVSEETLELVVDNFIFKAEFKLNEDYIEEIQ